MNGTLYTNVEVEFKGNPQCPKCHGKGYLNYSDRLGSVEQCDLCCLHDRGVYNIDNIERCKACGKIIQK